jgi:hypothetical protein
MAYKVHKYESTYWNSWPEPVDVAVCGREGGFAELEGMLDE